MTLINMWMLYGMAFISDKFNREEGQDFAEYAIILTLVVLVAAVAFTNLGTAVKGQVQAVADQLTGV